MGVLRITGGVLRGRKVPLPPGDLRPTSGRAREAFFNVVAASVPGSSFLDLYAGSGIFSLEAASRGAARVVAVDVSRRALQGIGTLARDWKLPVETMLSDAVTAVRRLEAAEPFDLVYVDPPYDGTDYDALVVEIDARLPLAGGARVAVEHRSGRLPFDPSPCRRLALRRTTRYSSVSITYLELYGDIDDTD